MITKFKTINEGTAILEFSKERGYVKVLIDDSNKGSNRVYLSEQDLFNLIGQLLRIQSELRKESKND